MTLTDIGSKLIGAFILSTRVGIRGVCLYIFRALIGKYRKDIWARVISLRKIKSWKILRHPRARAVGKSLFDI